MFETFSKNYKKSFDNIKNDPNDEYNWGAVAAYIPRLKEANPEWFASSFCSVDDQYV